MATRNFTMMEYYNKMAHTHRPSHAFSTVVPEGTPASEMPGCWRAWAGEARKALLGVLGPFPDPVDPNPEIEYAVEVDGIVRERIILDTERNLSMPCLLLRPARMKPDRRGAAILCVHGHGPYGKDPVAGVRGSREMEAAIAASNYNYGEQMARAGFLTLCPDLRGFGERRDPYDPIGGRDMCNVHYLKGSLFGRYPLTGNIWDMMCCVDYLRGRPEVDPERIGMMGLSQGGTVTTFTAAVDERIKAADIIAYVNPWAEFGIRHANFCGSQIVPAVYRYLDTHDIAGLIAPRPLLMEMGLYDACFPYRDLACGYRETRRIYEAAGAGGCIEADVTPVTHAFAGNRAFDFFRRHLACGNDG